MGVISYGPFRLERPFWTRSGDPIAIDVTPLDRPQLWRGKQDDREIVIDDDRDAGLLEILAPFRPDAADLDRLLRTKLRDRGLRPLTDEGDEHTGLQLTIDASWAASREYLGMIPVVKDADTTEYLATIPMGSHHVCFQIEATLEDDLPHRNEHHLLWTTTARACEPIPRRWREAGQQADIEKVVGKAWTEALENLEKRFFSWSGKRGVERTFTRRRQ